MNTMGCSFQVLAALALMVSFIPILNWTALVIALPFSLLGIVSAATSNRRNHTQSADKLVFWVAVALTATVLARVFIFA